MNDTTTTAHGAQTRWPGWDAETIRRMRSLLRCRYKNVSTAVRAMVLAEALTEVSPDAGAEALTRALEDKLEGSAR